MPMCIYPENLVKVGPVYYEIISQLQGDRWSNIGRTWAFRHDFVGWANNWVQIPLTFVCRTRRVMNEKSLRCDVCPPVDCWPRSTRQDWTAPSLLQYDSTAVSSSAPPSSARRPCNVNMLPTIDLRYHRKTSVPNFTVWDTIQFTCAPNPPGNPPHVTMTEKIKNKWSKKLWRPVASRKGRFFTGES